MADLSWTIPVGVELYKNKHVLRELFESIKTYLLGDRHKIVIFGIAGSGKTVLFDHIVGKAFESSYVPPGKSPRSEKEKVTKQDQRWILSTIPGQLGMRRHASIDKAIMDGIWPSLIIYAAPFGFADSRDDIESTRLIRSKQAETISQLRAIRMQEETNDLNRTLDELARAASTRKEKTPLNFLVACTKADLYPEEIAEAELRYSPLHDGEMCRVLNRAATQFGADHFRWDAIPVATWLEDFAWNDELLRTQLSLPARNAMFSAFIREVYNQCR